MAEQLLVKGMYADLQGPLIGQGPDDDGREDNGTLLEIGPPSQHGPPPFTIRAIDRGKLQENITGLEEEVEEEEEDERANPRSGGQGKNIRIGGEVTKTSRIEEERQ